MSNDKRRFIHSLLFPGFFLIVIWTIKLTEKVLYVNFSNLGIYPLKLKGLLGILTAPLIHADFEHLITNSIPVLLLSTGIFYFYKRIAYKVFFLSYFITNIWIWLGARYAYHIGASGLIYSFASFLFFSGILRKNIKLIAVSLLVVFLYGSMIWGLLPIQPQISWESHLMGAISGLVLAVYFKNHMPEKTIYSWELDDDDDDESGKKYWEIDDDTNETDFI
ncbi:MAG: rhomboid family intramembrane serine protease [Bacteroidales bacterium]|nr:rhomboid family intramembrane serine protease [Bacteroidales bacterium]